MYTNEKTILDRTQKLIIRRGLKESKGTDETFLEDIQTYLGTLNHSSQRALPKLVNSQIVIPCTDEFSDYFLEMFRSGALKKALGYSVMVLSRNITKLVFSPEICTCLETFFKTKTYFNELNNETYLDLSHIAKEYGVWAEFQGQVHDFTPTLNDVRLVNALVDYLETASITILILSNNKLEDLGSLTCPTGLKNAKSMIKLVLTDNNITSIGELKRLTYIKQLQAVVLTGNPLVKEPDFMNEQNAFPFTCIVHPRLPQQLPECKNYASFKYFIDIIYSAIKNGDSSLLAGLYTLNLEDFGVYPPKISMINHTVQIGDKKVFIFCSADQYMSVMSKTLDDKVLFIEQKAKVLSSSTSVLLNPYCTLDFSKGMPNLIRTIYICTGNAILRKRRPDTDEVPFTYIRTITLITPCSWDGSLKATLEKTVRNEFRSRIVADVAQFQPAGTM